jgi:hypothetical protein
MAKFRQGAYKPKNTAKYIGKKIPIFRSSWELRMFEHCDNSHNVKYWGSECVIIPYMLDQKIHRYYTDLLIVLNDGKRVVIEIKPLKQTKPPRKTKKKSRTTLLYENELYRKNLAKWNAAKEWCRKKGWEFKILTEKDILA